MKDMDKNDRHYSDVLNNMWLRNETLLARFNVEDTVHLLRYAISYAKSAFWINNKKQAEGMMEIAELAASIVCDHTP